MRTRPHIPFVLCGAVLGVAGCMDLTPEPPPPECSIKIPCPQGQVCYDAHCLYVCNSGEDCGPGLGCRQALCTTCDADNQCGGYFGCNETTGACLVECVTNADCKDEGYCSVDGLCVAREADGGSCTEGRVCASDNCLDGMCCPAGCDTACDGSRCLLSDGHACNEASECQSGICVDRTCCAEACDGPCETCFGAVPGVCEPVAKGTDFDSCATVCEEGLCLGSLGDACDDGEQCYSGFCAEGVCCDSACDGLCRSCTQEGSAGQCVPVYLQEYGACAPSAADGARMCDQHASCTGLSLVADINGHDGPAQLTELANGAIVFVSNARGLGRELWVYDAAYAEARVLADIREGPASGDIGELVKSGSGVGIAFTADDARYGREIWYADGQQAGVMDMQMGAASSDPGVIVTGGSSFYLVAESNRGAGTLWGLSDTGRGLSGLGVDADPSFAIIQYPYVLYATALNPGAGGYELVIVALSSGVRQYPVSSGAPLVATDTAAVASGYSVYFVGTTPANGRDLWRSTWTTNPANYPSWAPQLVADLCADGCDGMPINAQLAVAGSNVYAVGFDGTNLQLWRMDGTPAPVTSFSGCTLSHLTPLGSTLYFTSTCGGAHTLWKTTVGATPALSQVFSSGAAIGQVRASRDKLYFVASDGVHGAELWRTDPASASASLLDIATDVAPSDVCILASTTTATAYGTYFVATNEAEGQSLWYCDDTTASLGDACDPIDPLPGSASSYVTACDDPATDRDAIVAADGSLVFRALATSGGPAALWKVAPGAAPTQLALLDYGAHGSAPGNFGPGPAPERSDQEILVRKEKSMR